VINLALILLSRLKKRRIEDFDGLKAFAKKSVVGGDSLFLPSISFLYLLGLIDYKAKNGSFEYVGPNEAL